MNESVLRLLPGPQAALPLGGLYLAHRLHRFPTHAGLPFIYTNFISSLDGRISIRDPATGMRGVPSAIANPHDWRLYLELGAQADILLTTSRHLRAFAAERHQEIFDIGADEELSAWRISERLGPHPAIAVLSEGLDIPIEAVRSRIQGQFLVITGQHAPPQKISTIRSEGIDILQLPSGTVLDARALAKALFERGYERVYSVAGPRVTHALLSAGAIGRFYLTMVHLALGGRDFDTITLGDDLAPPRSFTLRELYFDSQLPTGAGQLFASLDFSAKPA